jgi:hypothetical protein
MRSAFCLALLAACSATSIAVAGGVNFQYLSIVTARLVAAQTCASVLNDPTLVGRTIGATALLLQQAGYTAVDTGAAIDRVEAALPKMPAAGGSVAGCKAMTSGITDP